MASQPDGRTLLDRVERYTKRWIRKVLRKTITLHTYGGVGYKKTFTQNHFQNNTYIIIYSYSSRINQLYDKIVFYVKHNKYNLR